MEILSRLVSKEVFFHSKLIASHLEFHSYLISDLLRHCRFGNTQSCG